MLEFEHYAHQIEQMWRPQLKQMYSDSYPPLWAPGFDTGVPQHFPDGVLHSCSVNIVCVLTPSYGIFEPWSDVDDL